LPLRTRKAAFSANGTGVVHIGTNAEARADAIRRVMGIFGALLKDRRKKAGSPRPYFIPRLHAPAAAAPT
jgi:hypothetical protein